MKHLAVLSVLPMLALLGCQPQSGESPQPADGRVAAPTAGPPTLEELKNATYRGFEEPAGPVTLVDGKWEGEPYQEGGATLPTVSFIRDFHVLGDLDGDGVDEAVVLIEEAPGGTGRFVHVALVARQGDELENVATTLLGDRVLVRGVRIEGGRMLVDVLRAGPEDASCCPGELATLGFAFEAGRLEPVEIEAEPTRFSLHAIAGTEWVLRSWTWDEAAPAEPEVTLQYVEGRFTGSSGCNRYSAPAKEAGTAPGDVEVGLGIGTRMACPDPAGAIESRFLKQLEGVNRLGFMAGQLMLSYEKDEASGVMLFDGRPPVSPDEP